MEMLNLLVLSDLHGSEDALKMLREVEASGRFDLILVCGDFTTYGTAKYVRRFLSSARAQVLAVPGNCDTPEIADALEDSGTSLHNRRTDFRGRPFFGFGGAPVTSQQMPFEVEEDVIEDSLMSVAARGGVMVTHTPAYGMNDRGFSGHHSGSKGIMRVAREFEPVLAVSGHIHEDRGTRESGGTVFVNPGPANRGFYAKVELGDSARAVLKEHPPRR